MKRLTLLLVPAVLIAGQARYARLGEFEGNVEVQLTAADPWMPAERNLPLIELAWVRTGAGSRAEIELDDGSALRLGPDSQAEISDYSRLSTGQRMTILSLDHGLAYFTGEPAGQDILMLVAPGLQVTLNRGARVRLRALTGASHASVVEGVVRFSSPTAEMDLQEGRTVRVEPATTQNFWLDSEVLPMALDRWSEARDRAEAAPLSAGHVVTRGGLADLDAGGQWIDTVDLGPVWKPKAASGWAPFQRGRWRWYDTLGYTWVSDDPWGWLPYHYGRWALNPNVGWVWAPGIRTVFKPGEVYWLRGQDFAGWGPLAPGEQWSPAAGPPAQFAEANTTYAVLQPEARTIDPAGFAAPISDALRMAAFALALPSPTMEPSRLDAMRPMLRVGSTRIKPVIPGITLQDNIPDLPPAAPGTGSIPPETTDSDVPADAPPPPDGIYPPVVAVPVATDVIVVSPDHPGYSRPPRGNPPANPYPGPGYGPPVAPLAPPVAPPAPSPVLSGGRGSPIRNSDTEHTPSTERNERRPREPEPPPRHEPLRPVAPPSPPQPAAPAADRHESPRPVVAPSAPPPEHRDVPRSAPSAAPPASPAQAPKAEPSRSEPAKSDSGKRGALQPTSEYETYARILNHLNAGNASSALTDLDAWSVHNPKSELQNHRLYLYMQAHSKTSPPRPDQVLYFGGQLMAKDLHAMFPDATQVFQVLYLSMVAAGSIQHPNPRQAAQGRQAATELLNFMPVFFSNAKKPSGATAAAWAQTRAQVESTARHLLSSLSKPAALTADVQTR